MTLLSVEERNDLFGLQLLVVAFYSKNEANQLQF